MRGRQTLVLFNHGPIRRVASYSAQSKTKEVVMNRWAVPLKMFSFVVVLLMGVAILYAGVISVMYWSGISV